jgi:4-hydroxy-tetrahydrodipicolinate synthase
MAMLGRGNGEMRLPMCEPEAKVVDALRRSLARYGLLAAND